jgi:ATP-dependent Lon protease
MPKNIKQNLEIRPVQWIDEVLDIALAGTPTPRREGKAGSKSKSAEKNAENDKRTPRHH